jgi:hypothetical protein
MQIGGDGEKQVAARGVVRGHGIAYRTDVFGASETCKDDSPAPPFGGPELNSDFSPTQELSFLPSGTRYNDPSIPTKKFEIGNIR